MTTVLVVGAGGFLGSTVVGDLVNSGYRVRALVRKPPSPVLPPMVDLVYGDIRDSQSVSGALVGCDAVIHLAGIAHALEEGAVAEDEYHAVNVEGTKHLLDAAVTHGVPRFVFASSVKVFGEVTNGCVDESVLPAPQTPYARSKWHAEQLVASYADQNALTAVSLRLPLVYGPTPKGNLFRMIQAIDRGRFPPMPRVKTVRSLLHVKNFSLAIQAALRTPRFLKRAYIVADAAPWSVTDIYDQLRAGLGLPPAHWRIPLWVLLTGAKCGDAVERLRKGAAPFSSATLSKLIGEAWYSPQAFMRDAGYQPRYTFDAAVPELVSHARSAQL